MIDLTPLDVRKKRGDFTKGLRGYDSQQVDSFLELVAERMEEVVKENLTLRERVEQLSAQVDAQSGREKAVNDALVTAQQLREEIQTSAQREADLVRRECESEVEQLRRAAQADADRLRSDAENEAAATLRESERKLAEQTALLQEMERRRARFLVTFRQLLERELDMVTVQEGREPLKDMPIDLDLGGGRPRDPEPAPESDPVAAPEAVPDPAPEMVPETPMVRAEHEPEGAQRDEEGRPSPDADVHRLAADPHRLAADPPPWTDTGAAETDDSEDDDAPSEDAWLSSILDEEDRREDV